MTEEGFAINSYVPESATSDEFAVARFEQLAQRQTPATTQWRPVTDYSFGERQRVEGSHPQLIGDVFQPRRVLDAGCGPKAILVELLRAIGVDACGFDLSVEGSRRHGLPGHLCLADLTMPVGTFPVKAVGRADLVICREVLEHLPLLDVRRAVANLVRLSTRYVYVTTRYAKAPDHLLAVDTSDDLDPTHITMLTKPMLRLLFVLEGCVSRYDLEDRMDWKGLGRCLVFEVPH